MGNLLTTQSEGDSATYVYDKAGRTLRVTQNGETTRTLYDDEGRTVQEIAPEDYDSSKDGLPNTNTYFLYNFSFLIYIVLFLYLF